VIKTVNLSKVFRADEIETTALNNVSFEVKEREFVAIMGPSGCGKSTLLNILGLLDNSTNGEYYFLNQKVNPLSERQRAKLRKKNIGFIFQNFNLIDELNVFENVELPLLYLGMTAKDRKARIYEILDEVEIGHRRKHFPAQLSGGQQQRVAVARALVANPSLILADEPTGNLDSTHGEEVMNMFTKLNENGTTIIMVTHNHRDAKFSRRIINLFDGQIVSENR